MKLLFALISLFVIVYSPHSIAQDCDIYIHGYTPNGKNYFGDLERQVLWNANQEVESSAPEVAQKILKQIDTCPYDSNIVLRPHSYGAAQVHYILAKGRRFQHLFPEHDFVRVYQAVNEVYAYTGAYHGTPLMDLVCLNKLTRAIGAVVGRSCVRTLTTSKVENIAYIAGSPGVPTHLITSSNRSGFYGIPGTILAKHMVSWRSYLFGGVRNQNDNTLPLYATNACADKKVMQSSGTTCLKIDSTFFVDFVHTRDFNHQNFLKNEEFMRMVSENENEF